MKKKADRALHRFTWEAFNHTYGPWYRLRALDADGVSVKDLKSGGRTAEAVVQPDMDRGSWYWSVKFSAYRPRLKKQGDKRSEKQKNLLQVPMRERRVGGRVDDLEEAKEAAIAAFLVGRPVP